MVALTDDGTLTFVARTDAQRVASVEQFRIAVPQSNVVMVIWIDVGTGPIAAAGLDRIEQAQRELDTLGSPECPHTHHIVTRTAGSHGTQRTADHLISFERRLARASVSFFLIL
ncbi:hypothetical protein J6K27_000054 [Rhodococcus qingshengii]|uniref:hypothetical protein n=1 Tax=Rhodococcus qingshengii TaxID=334542 RepID=UPI001AEFFD79|nr:hypothetical protein [Rhodococcus qingshengii]QTS00554.1 hypothetical protein J6K27_000054 [Rhodococcus qingshengii]